MLSEYLTCSVFIRQALATVNCTALSMCHVFYSRVSNRKVRQQDNLHGHQQTFVHIMHGVSVREGGATI